MSLKSFFESYDIYNRNVNVLFNYNSKTNPEKFELVMLIFSIIQIFLFTPILSLSLNYITPIYLFVPLTFIPLIGFITGIFAFIMSQYFPIEKYYSETDQDLSIFEPIIHTISFITVLILIFYVTYILFISVPIINGDPMIMEVDEIPENNFVIRTEGHAKFTVRGDVDNTITCIESCVVSLNDEKSNTLKVYANRLHIRYGHQDEIRDGRYIISYLRPDTYYDGEFENPVSYSMANSINKIQQWGDIKWISMRRSYTSSNNLTVKADDNPDLSDVERMNSAFYATEGFKNSSVNKWDTSNVKDMSYMFAQSDFNQDISSWDTSNVIFMNRMFYESSFNQSISDWNTSNVKHISFIFKDSKFNQDISDWNISNVNRMNSSFASSKFNQDISDWNTSNVKYMNRMFCGNEQFNQDISDWNTSNVKDMDFMFYNASDFSQNINNWDIKSTDTNYGMFYNSDINKKNYDQKWSEKAFTDYYKPCYP